VAFLCGDAVAPLGVGDRGEQEKECPQLDIPIGDHFGDAGQIVKAMAGDGRVDLRLNPELPTPIQEAQGVSERTRNAPKAIVHLRGAAVKAEG